MATTPQGDDSDVRKSVMEALTRAVARQRMARRAATSRKPKRLTGAQSLATYARPGALR
jgi:hypothetical protein